MRDSKGIFVALVSHDGVFCKRFIDSASSWEAFGLKLVLNTRDPKSPTDPHWSWLLGTESKAGQPFLPRCAAWSWAALGLWCRVMAVCFGLLADTGALLSVRSAFPGTGVEKCGDGGEKCSH